MSIPTTEAKPYVYKLVFQWLDESYESRLHQPRAGARGALYEYPFELSRLLVNGKEVCKRHTLGIDGRPFLLAEWLQKNFWMHIVFEYKKPLQGLTFAAPEGVSTVRATTSAPDGQNRIPMLNGACGLDAMVNILKMIGMTWEPERTGGVSRTTVEFKATVQAPASWWTPGAPGPSLPGFPQPLGSTDTGLVKEDRDTRTIRPNVRRRKGKTDD